MNSTPPIPPRTTKFGTASYIEQDAEANKSNHERKSIVQNDGSTSVKDKGDGYSDQSTKRVNIQEDNENDDGRLMDDDVERASTSSNETIDQYPDVDIEFWNQHALWEKSIVGSGTTVEIKDPKQGNRSLLHPNPPTTYLVISEHSVRRRYSDFEWLRNTLKSRYLGIFIPPLPEKRVVGNKSESFLKSRMRGLRLFLRRLLENSFLYADVATIAFLSETNASDWKLFKSKLKYDGNESEKRWQAVLKRFEVPSDVERRILGAEEQLRSLKSALSVICNSATQLIVTSVAHNQSIIEFNSQYQQMLSGTTFKSSQISANHNIEEGSQVRFMTILQKLGSIYSDWANLQEDQPNIIEQLFVEAFRFEKGCIQEVRRVIDERNKKIDEYNRLCGILRKLQVDKNAQLINGQPDTSGKVQKKVETVKEQAKRANAEVNLITKGLFYCELHEFSIKKVQRLNKVISTLAAANLKHANKAAELWSSCIDDKQDSDIADSSCPKTVESKG